MSSEFGIVLRSLTVLIPLFIPSSVVFAQQTDSLYLKNGQIVFGDLKGISLGKVKFKMDDLSTVDVEMNKIETISANKHFFRIETVNKKVFFSKLYSSPKSGFVRVEDSLGGGELPINYIIKATYYKLRKNIFEGNVSSGYNYTKSSDIGRFNLDLTMRYIMKNITIQNKSSSIMTQQDKALKRDRESILFTGTYFIDPTWKAIGLLNYQLNRELGLQYRFQEGIGAGYNIFANTSLRLWTVAGLVVNQEKSFEESNSNLTVEVPFLLNFDLFRFSKPEISVSVDNSFFTSLTQKGRIRFDNEVRADWKVISDFTLNLQFYSNYDNKPLSGTGAAFDYGIVFGIGYKWD